MLLITRRSRVRIPPPLLIAKSLQLASFSRALVWRGNGRVTHFSVTRPFICVVLQQGSRCKQLPSLERLSADVRVVAPDGAVLLGSRFGSAGASRTPHAERGAPGRRSGWASSGAVVDTLVGPDFGRRSLRVQASTWPQADATSILRHRALVFVWAPTSRSRLLRLVCSKPPDR